MLANVVFPFEKSLASVAVAGPGARRCTRKRPEDRRAFKVSDGRRTLKDITGCGVSVTVLKEETVIPRNEVVSDGPVGSVAVIIATGYGTWRMRRRTCSDIEDADVEEKDSD
jgi:hypothetical protein